MRYTTSCNTQSSVPEDGQNNCLKHAEVTGIINKPLLLHLVGCLYHLYFIIFFLRLAKQSQFIPLQNVVYFIPLPFLVRKIFAFYINDVLLFKCPFPGPKGQFKTFGTVDIHCSLSQNWGMSRDSSVDTETRYGLDGPGIESLRGRDFPHASIPALGFTQPPVRCVPGLFTRLKRPGRGVGHPPSSSAKVKESVELYLYSTLSSRRLF